MQVKCGKWRYWIIKRIIWNRLQCDYRHLSKWIQYSNMSVSAEYYCRLASHIQVSKECALLQITATSFLFQCIYLPLEELKNERNSSSEFM
jgi:hypothetical protein